MTPFTLPPDYARIQVVRSFEALVETPFEGQVNAICWQRDLPGDFDEVVARLDAPAGITTLDEAQLMTLPLSPAGRAAMDVLLEDLRRLRELGQRPSLDCIHVDPRQEERGSWPTDVHSFHVDSAPVPTDTFLCCYAGPASECLRNDEALPRVTLPEARAELLARYGGAEGPGFETYLHETFHDRHYGPVPGARPFTLGTGNLWRLAVEHPQSPVPACIHRAPENPGAQPRLLLIS